MTFEFDPVYLRAAAAGDGEAQAGLAALLLSNAQQLGGDNPAAMNELLIAAESFARLAATHKRPFSAATLGTVWFMRSLMLADSDPVRSLWFRDQADGLFDWVAEAGDAEALAMVAHTLITFADVAGDEAAASRLNTIVELLPPETAVAVREWSRALAKSIAPAPVKEAE